MSLANHVQMQCGNTQTKELLLFVVLLSEMHSQNKQHQEYMIVMEKKIKHKTLDLLNNL